MPQIESDPAYPDLLPTAAAHSRALDVIALMQSGGDARIVLDPLSGLNRYMSSPYPRKVVAYASSTANDVGEAAFAHACFRLGEEQLSFGEALEALRARIRAAYGVADDQPIAFAASGTDLEYIALAAVHGRAGGGIHNVLLGADEVGSGCIFSANGRYFAEATPLGIATEKGDVVPGFELVSLADVTVRCGEGRARSSADMAGAIDVEIEMAQGLDQHTLVHVVHGSKTGLILPDLADIDAIQRRWGDKVTFVVDACQARITSEALNAYLERGAIVLLTGSKFMGGAPFNAFAMVPNQVLERCSTPCAGMATLFNRAELPLGWPGRDTLPDGENRGLQLRLDAAIFELERFQRLPMEEVERVIAAFERAIACELLAAHGLQLVKPYAPGEREEAKTHPIEMRTLATIDVSSLPRTRTFEDAQAVHAQLALSGLRLGQPVKCVRLSDLAWGGTLRIGLSMPQMVRFAKMEPKELASLLERDMRRIGDALVAEPVS